MSARYAVYFTPEDGSPLSIFGERVLGRTADGNIVADTSDDFPNRAMARQLSATPAHYGFHATLKAPFHLITGATDTQLLEAVEVLAAAQSPIVMHSLRPSLLSSFMALCFDTQPQAVEQLAEQCVKSMEPWRAAMTPEDLARRRPDQLSVVQRKMLNQYGYPFVLSEFKFHMTLTGALVPAEHEHYIDWLCELYEKVVPEPPTLDRLAVFQQPDKSTPFTRLAQFPFQ